MISRRALLQGGAALSVGAVAQAAEGRAPAALYVSHGAPLFMPGQDARRVQLAEWGRGLAKPRGIVVMTPHFALRGLTIGKVGEGFAWYDLPGGLKRQLPQDLEYRTPSNECLVAELRATLGEQILSTVGRRGFDHTTWMPLLCLRPAADVPVLELCYPYVSEMALFELGKRLAPLAHNGVCLLASGGFTHNLGLDFLSGPTPAFATEFDAWGTERVQAHDIDALCDWRNKAPAATLAHPDDGAHFRVILAALGIAAAASRASVTSPVQGFEASLSKRCFELG